MQRVFALHISKLIALRYSFLELPREALKKVASDGQARRNQTKKRSLQDVNEHFESDFNTA